LNVPSLEVGLSDPFIDSELDDGLRIIYPVKNIARAVESIDPDIVVFHTIHQGLVNDLARIKGNYPVLARVGINTTELLLMEAYQITVPPIVAFLRAVDHLICASKNTVNQMKGFGVPEDRLTYIPTVVDPTKFEKSTCSDPTILIMGRISTVKNHLTLIQAYKLVKDVIPDAELAIAGQGGTLKQVLDAVMKEMALTDYKFVGYIKDLNHLFGEVAVLVLPSISENLPQSVVEAYAAGIPCVIADCGWGDSFEACLKAHHDDPRAIADHIIRLITDRDFWLEIRNAQLKELEQKFDLQKALDEYERLFIKYSEMETYFASQEDDVKKRLEELGIKVA